jgi:putative NIF3 family GTP cyclohydrolase 1 type 2
MEEACCEKLREYNITHFYIHSPLDFVDFGTCTSLMNVIGIDEIIKYSYYEDGEYPGIGEFHEPLEFSTLIERMRTELNEPVRAWKNNQRPIKKIGIVTGAGHSTDHIKRAIDEGCDTYITGEATLYKVQYAEFVGINLFVGSHTFTEVYGVQSLAKKIKEANKGIEIIKINERHFELNH